MASTYAAIEIDAPIESVFGLYSKYDRHSEWQPGLLRAELTSGGPVAVGTRGLEVRRMFGRQIAFPCVITEHEPPSRSAFRTLEGPLRPAGTATFVAMERATRMQFSMELGIRGVLRAVEALLAPLFARQTQRDLERFKAWVQAELSADGRVTRGMTATARRPATP